jgi:hypothetical protein
MEECPGCGRQLPDENTCPSKDPERWSFMLGGRPDHVECTGLAGAAVEAVADALARAHGSPWCVVYRHVAGSKPVEYSRVSVDDAEHRSASPGED